MGQHLCLGGGRKEFLPFKFLEAVINLQRAAVREQEGRVHHRPADILGVSISKGRNSLGATQQLGSRVGL